jgi:diacylglycerol kinase (ATP)
LELGRLADGHPFVNVASAGLASVAARRAQPLKPRFGPLAYAMGAARAAVTGRPLPVAVSVDGRVVFEGGAWQVIVACTGAFGGGSGIGAADATDGDVDVVIVPAGSRLSLVRRAWGLRTRTVERQRAVPHYEGREVSVELPEGTEINCDGEIRCGGLERVTAVAAAFGLVVP